MSFSAYKKNASIEDYMQKTERLVIPFSITHNATPASKIEKTDLSSALVLSCQGQTAAAAAIDSACNFASATDSTGVFGMLLYNLGTVSKVLNVSVVLPSAAGATFALNGASSSGVTASGNIAFSVTAPNSLATTDYSGNLVIEYSISKE